MGKKMRRFFFGRFRNFRTHEKQLASLLHVAAKLKIIFFSLFNNGRMRHRCCEATLERVFLLCGCVTTPLGSRACV
jgi:hypothetical protein